MKKIFLLITFAIFINCSLDTFNSDNLASWSVNLDLPLFRTSATYADLLDDYDELGVEPYQDTADSIYVFNASTQHEVTVDGYVIEKVGNSITPILVNVPNYEIDVPTLPEELDGINFVDIDLTIETDLTQFRVDLADSVIVNTILLTATNDDGGIATATIRNQDLLIDGVLVVEDPEDLINIRPTSVVVSGDITVYPTDQPGKQVFEQAIILISRLHAPLILEITEASTFESNPEVVGGDVEELLVESFTLFAQIDNQMEIGGELIFLVSPDTLNFFPGSFIIPDTLMSIQLLPDQEQMETIELGADKFDLISSSTYMKTYLSFIGNINAQGATVPTHFFTNDSLKVLVYSSAELLIDPQDDGGKE